jgi:diguanylate cyclase (GGDEF)-like protein
MQDTQQETATESNAHAVVRRTERDAGPADNLGRLRWALRACGALFAMIGGAALSAAYVADVGWEFHVINGLVITAIVLMGYSTAAISRRSHVELEQRYRARLFIRNLELQDMAMRDDLTQLFNRRYFFERLRRELDRARSLQSPLAIIVLDVDQLKGVNDTYGHAVGDLVLANLAKLLVKCTRTSDIPARLGGDEFGVIMPETDKDGAFAVANRIQRALEVNPVYEQDGDCLRMSVSLGVSGFPWGGDSVDEIVQWADTHMYAAKTSHRNNARSLSDSRERSPKKV